jgi:hypothetical protein
MRVASLLFALLSVVSVGSSVSGCGDDQTHVTYIGSIDASPAPPRLGRPQDAGTD